MTPSEQVKAAGLKSLLQASQLTGISPQTLSSWCKIRPKLFNIVLIGCVNYLILETNKEIQNEKDADLHYSSSFIHTNS